MFLLERLNYYIISNTNGRRKKTEDIAIKKTINWDVVPYIAKKNTGPQVRGLF